MKFCFFTVHYKGSISNFSSKQKGGQKYYSQLKQEQDYIVPLLSGVVIGVGVLACVGIGFLFPEANKLEE